ncbi:MAG: copper resistance system multicopper oxidase [Pseudomonadota bacterium]
MRHTTRRNLLKSTLALGCSAALLPDWARSAATSSADVNSLAGTEFDLAVDQFPVQVGGIRGRAIGVNGTVPAPLLRWREGDHITLNVRNNLKTETSIHWHGILLPFHMDGVPGVSFPGISPGESFRYHFPVKQAGTYWYHSHSGLQEQIGHYGPIIIDPAGRDPVDYDREYVVMLSDWTFMSPHKLFLKLKKDAESLNFNRPTLGKPAGLGGMWGAMRMSPRDVADVTGATYTYVINGHATEDNFAMHYEPGERVRLRIINSSAMTLFNVRIPGLPMTVVQSDGLDLEPVETDEFQIGVAETYDVIVQPESSDTLAFVAESIDRSGQVVATLSSRARARAAVPPIRPRPMLTMADMGHGQHTMDSHDAMHPDGETHTQRASHAQHADMAHGAERLQSHSTDAHTMHRDMASADRDHSEMQSEGTPGHEMAHAGHKPDPHGPSEQPIKYEAAVSRGPGVVNLVEAPASRLDEPGIGLEAVGHRVLRYSQLRSLTPNPDARTPEREVVLHLTSNMERYMWSFDGVKFSEVTQSIQFQEGERVRLTLVNDTMMPHPIHLHGMFFEVDNGAGAHRPRKHTVIVKPAEKLSVDVTAEHVGDWAFHCHLLYHMHAGMMQVVSILPKPEHVPHEHDQHEA